MYWKCVGKLLAVQVSPQFNLGILRQNAAYSCPELFIFLHAIGCIFTLRLKIEPLPGAVAGEQWAADIAADLRSAQAAILLVSADFLASDFITSRELPALLQRAPRGQPVGATLIVAPLPV